MSELKADNTFVFGEECLAYKKSEADKVIAELKNEIEVQKRLRNMALASVPNVLKVMKIIQRQKYKRCLAMAERCETNVYNIRRKPLCDMDDHEGWQHDDEFWQRWHKRWLELAEKFKEVK